MTVWHVDNEMSETITLQNKAIKTNILNSEINATMVTNNNIIGIW